jgi:hypothetical protein
VDETGTAPQPHDDLGRKAVIGVLVGWIALPAFGRLVQWALDATSSDFLQEQSGLVFKVLGAVGFVYGVFAVWEWGSARYRERRARNQRSADSAGA